MPGPEGLRRFVEVRAVKPRIPHEPFITGRTMFEIAREALTAPRTPSVIQVDRDNGVISIQRKIEDPMARSYVEKVSSIPEVMVVSYQDRQFFTLIDHPGERDTNIPYEESFKVRAQVYDAEAEIYRGMQGDQDLPEFRLLNVRDFEDPAAMYEQYTQPGTTILLDRRAPQPTAA